MKKVLIYKTDLLNLSETFVREQAQACREWTPVFAGMQRVKGLSLDDFDVTLLADTPRHMHGLAARLLRRLHLPHPRHVLRLARLRPALIHVHFGTDAVDLWPAARCLGVPMVVTLHGYDIMTYEHVWRSIGGARGRYPQRLVAMSRSPRVHFIAVSDAIRQRAIECGLPAERVVIKHIGIDVGKFQHAGKPVAEREPHILFVGRLVEKKGIRYLIDAYAKLMQHVPAAMLTIVGDGPLRAELEAHARQLNVEPRFVGNRTPEQLRTHLAEARAFCLPSVRAANGDAEGFGMVLLEAQACGVPVVTSAMGGAQEGIIDGVTGFAFAERDVVALAAALEKLLTDDALAAHMSTAARRFVEDRFDLARCTHTLEQYYDEIMERNA